MRMCGRISVTCVIIIHHYRIPYQVNIPTEFLALHKLVCFHIRGTYSSLLLCESYTQAYHINVMTAKRIRFVSFVSIVHVD